MFIDEESYDECFAEAVDVSVDNLPAKAREAVCGNPACSQCWEDMELLVSAKDIYQLQCLTE